MDNTMSLNAELFRQLSYIADDRICMKKALEFIKELVIQKEEHQEQSKEEILQNIDQSFKELKMNLDGKLELNLAEDLLNEL